MTPDEIQEHVRALMIDAARELADDTMGISETLEDILPSETDAERAAYDSIVNQMAALVGSANVVVFWAEDDR